MSDRRPMFVALIAAVVVATLCAPAVARASVLAPVLVRPVGVTVPDTAVDFAWDRSDGATGYHLTVRRGGAGGTVLLDEYTVNDRFIGTINLAGDTAWWTVAALQGDHTEVAWASATFTTARLAPTLLAPDDRATITFPEEAATPRWASIPGQYETLRAGRGGDVLETKDASQGQYEPGDWTWRVDGSWAIPEGTAPASSETRHFSVEWPDATPAPTSPADGATFPASMPFRLEWDPVPGAGLYDWQLSPVGGSRVRWASMFGIHANWAVVDGALAPGEYEWQARAIMSGTAYPSPIFGPWSAPRTVTVAAPAAPDAQSPADGATLDAWPVLRWSAIANVAHYELQVAASQDPDGPIRTPAPLANAFAFDAPGASGIYSATTAPASRWWRVRAVTPSNVQTGWSPWRSFSVTPTPGALPAAVSATRLGPPDCVTDACADVDGIPLLRWSPVPGASSYRVFFRWDGSPGEGNAWVDVGSPGLAVTQYFQLTPGDRTAWAVLACPAGGCPEMMPLNRWHFRIGIPAPTQTGPPDGTVQQRSAIEMHWLPLPPPTHPDALPLTLGGYDVEYTITPGAGTPQDLYRDSGGMATSFTRDTVRPGTTLAWRVHSKSILNYGELLDGAWSPWRSVTRTEPPITLVGPSSTGTVDATPTLRWEPLPFGVLTYRVEVARTSALSWYGPEYWAWATFTGASSMTLPELAPGEYRWRVRREEAMYNQGEGVGPWSSGLFTVAGEPVVSLVSPAPDEHVRADGVVLTWDPYPTATSYSVLIGTTPDLTGENAIYGGYAVTNIHPVSQTLPSGQLYWKVCSPVECSETAGLTTGESTVRTLQVIAPPGPDLTPPIATIKAVSPRLGQAIGTTGTVPSTVTWLASDVGLGIASQDLQMRRDTGGWVTVPVTPSARSASVSLTKAHTYSFRIRAHDKAGNIGAWSNFAVKASLRQDSSSLWSWSRGWTRAGISTASGGSTRWSKRTGAKASTIVTGKAIGIVSPKSTGRGTASIWVDGLRVATVRLDASPRGARRILYVKTWASTGTHRVTVKVSGTSGHPRVDVDALVIFR